MPIYDFICHDCNKTFSQTTSIEDYEKHKDKMKCPHCESTKTERHWEEFYVVTSKKS